MRIVFVGASPIAVLAASELVRENREVVIVEKDRERIDELRESLDCGFVHGDGSRPSVVEDLSPKNVDFLFCLSSSDQDNILASLVARSLGVERVVTKIEDPEYESICRRLGLEDTIVPDREVAQSLAALVAGHERASLTAAIEGNLRFFTVVAGEDERGPLGELDLPKGCRAIALTRDHRSWIADERSEVRADDRVLILAEEERIDELHERFGVEEHRSRDRER